MLSVRMAVAFLFCPLLAAEPQGARGAGFESCEALFAAHPRAQESAKCFFSEAGSPASSAAVEHRLDEILAQHPELPWPSFYLGFLEWSRPRSAELYRVAAGRFKESGEIQGEYKARVNLRKRLIIQGHFEEALFEEQRSIKLAELSGDPDLVANAKVVEARVLLSSGRDLGGASALIAEAERALSRRCSDELKGDWLAASGEVNLQIGRFDKARDSFRSLAELARSMSIPPARAHNMETAQYGLLRVLIERAAERPSDYGKEEILAQARATLTAAQSDDKKCSAEFILGELTTGVESRDHFARCEKAAATPAMASFCQGGWAAKLANEDPRQAREVLEKALPGMEKSEDPWLPLFFWGDQMRVSWRTLPPRQAIADSRKALQAVEALRRTQSPASQAGLFSTWSDGYYWFSGTLLARPGRTPDDIREAFAVTEHLRGRTLLEKRAGAGLEPLSKERLTKQRIGVIEAIKNVGKRVGDLKLPRSERENARQDLLALMGRQGEIERQLQVAGSTASEGPRLVTLDEVRQSLAPNEALLSFQVAPVKDWTGDFAGGSWLTVVTGAAHTLPRVYPFAGREELRRRMEDLTHPLAAYETGPEETQNLVKLYQLLLAPALQDLPQGVRRLIILADDDLHKLPFGALRKAEKSPALVDRYEITLAPSATIWLRWRHQNSSPATGRPALVLADPVYPRKKHLSRLTRSAEEGRTILAALGGGRLLLRQDASEASLRAIDLNPYGIVHLATHSVADEENPEHSAVILTSGFGGDGDLRVGEIVQLAKHGMEGKVVVLSSCESAGGQILRGEGVLSLARAFFEAGAHTVVGSLWPVEDRDGMKLFEHFYRHLGQGASVAAALRAAQRDRIDEKAPLQAWAAFVVLGNGDLIPFPNGRPASPLRVPLGITAFLAALFAALLAFGATRAFRRSRRRLLGQAGASAGGVSLAVAEGRSRQESLILYSLPNLLERKGLSLIAQQVSRSLARKPNRLG